MTMTMHAVLMTDEELSHARPTEADSGFGGLATARGHLPLKAMSVDTRVTGLTATTELEQTFVNVLDEPLEATYIFPLPDRAAVTRFELTVGTRRIEGVLKERGEARREYTAALAQGHRAAITEEDRAGVFTLRVGNLMPGDIATVRLGLSGPLPCADGEVTLRFPLVVAPRYIPGRALPGAGVGSGTAADTDLVPDASRISPPVLLPGFPSPVRLSMTVRLDGAGLPLGHIRSSLHTVTESSDGSGTVTLRLQPGERLDRDFILRFTLGGGRLASSLVLEPDAQGDAGTFMLTLVPPARAQLAAARPRDVVFVLDRSGSMDGWKMVAARRTIGRMLDTLRDGDRFTVIAFDDQQEWPAGFGASILIDATDRHRFRVLEWLAQVGSRGGTEMAAPLERAAQLLGASDSRRDRVLVLVTDGQVGNEDQILRELGRHLQGTRVFAVGIDRAVNSGFLERLGALGGGGWELVESEDRLDECMDRIHRRIGTPVLTELTLHADGLTLETDSQVPARLPDVFAGAPVVVSGRYRGAARGHITVHGRDAQGLPQTEQVAAHAATGRAAAWQWARGRVRELEDRFATGRGDRALLEQQIVRTSLGFGVLSRFTAFVAVDRAEVVNIGGAQHHVTQPVESPSGWGQGQAPQAQLKRRSAPSPAPSGQPARLGAARAQASAPVFFDKAERAKDAREEEAERMAPTPPPAMTSASMAPPSPRTEVPSMAPPEREEGLMEKGKRAVTDLLGRARPSKVAAPMEAPERVLVAKLLASTRDALQVATSDDARRRALEALWMALEGVLEKLARRGARDPALTGLHQRLGLAFSQAAPVDVAALWKDAEQVLATFAGVPVTPPPASGESFWTRG